MRTTESSIVVRTLISPKSFFKSEYFPHLHRVLLLKQPSIKNEISTIKAYSIFAFMIIVYMLSGKKNQLELKLELENRHLYGANIFKRYPAALNILICPLYTLKLFKRK